MSESPEGKVANLMKNLTEKWAGQGFTVDNSVIQRTSSELSAFLKATSLIGSESPEKAEVIITNPPFRSKSYKPNLNVQLNKVLEEGSIIDNRRIVGPDRITLLDILAGLAGNSEGLKCAVGYLYLEGLFLLIDQLRSLKEIKILMGSTTTRLTKEELIRAFSNTLNQIEATDQNVAAITLFHSLVKESKTLQVLAYFGDGTEVERLHSKAYLFLRSVNTNQTIDRYKVGIVGSSNLTPSGLVGNTELNTILTNPKDLAYLESWFDELWQHGFTDFGRLNISQAISYSIENSKFGKYIPHDFVYVIPREFFKLLINYLKADYLFEDWSKTKLFDFQRLDAIRCLRLFNEKGNRGVFLTSSVGLGKSYVACQVAKYFISEESRVLLVAPSGLIQNQDQWPRYLKESDLFHKVDMLRMGLLQKNPQSFEASELGSGAKYALIIVDEAHNYRNEDAYRTRNLKRIIDKNGDSRVLFLTATPINTSLDNLLNLIRLFYRPGSSVTLDAMFRTLVDMVKVLDETPYEELSKEEKEKLERIQRDLESELFVKSTRLTIQTSAENIQEIKALTGVDISKIPDPHINEVVYNLDKKYKDVVNQIVPFITSLTAAHLRIIEPEKGARLGAFFKWILYKRFESEISSYYLTLKRIHKKNRLIQMAIEKRDVNVLEDEGEEYFEDEVEVVFDIDYKRKLASVIEKIASGRGGVHLQVLKDLKADAVKIEGQISNLKFFLQDSRKILFIDDRKLSELLEIIRESSSKKILIFTEYRDTLRTINQFLSGRFNQDEIKFVDSNTKYKTRILSRFNDPNDKLRILVTTDTLSEGFNISGADVVVNFDIPYNPVRLIQRIGRATRLDKPKEIRVLNFRPDDDIDKELDLVETLQMRIEDIIRFVGLEYRIWFEREAELLKARRKFDLEIYRKTAIDVLKGVREDMWKGNFAALEVQIPYSNPALAMMQQAIMKYGITKEEAAGAQVKDSVYTVLRGQERLVGFYGGAKTYNESALKNVKIEEAPISIQFEKAFAKGIAAFNDHVETEKRQELVMSYFNDRMERMVKSIIDVIRTQHLEEFIPSAKDLRLELMQVRGKAGASTGSVIRDLHQTMRSQATEDELKGYLARLRDSYTQRTQQQKLTMEDKPSLLIGFVE